MPEAMQVRPRNAGGDRQLKRWQQLVKRPANRASANRRPLLFIEGER